ncbi:MAG: hypothetical protein KF819_23785 [Labilithrix sp.]|nr:hypothetical protein [Labilithrix sp.]
MLPFFPVHMDVANQAYVQVRAEERFRSGNDTTAAETELNPLVRYDLIWGHGQNHFVALYQPRLVYTHTFQVPTIDENVVNPETLNLENLRDPNRTPLSTLHGGGGGIEILRQRYRLSVYQFFAYGPVTTTSLLVQAPWTGDGPPPDPNPIIPSTIAVRLTLLFLQTQVQVPIRISRRVALTPSFVYNAFGGADSESRGVIALTSGPGAGLALEVAATRDDRLTTSLGAARIVTAFQDDREGATILRAEATQSWRHWYSKNLSTELIAGGTVGGDEITGFSLFSIASAGLLYDSYPLVRLEPGAPPMGAPPGHGQRLQVGLIAKATPWVDLFSGELEQRFVGTLATNYTVDRTTLRVQGSYARVVNTPRSVAQYQLVQAEGGVRYRIHPTFALDGGVRYGIQNIDNAIRVNDISQATVYAGLLWQPLPGRF